MPRILIYLSPEDVPDDPELAIAAAFDALALLGIRPQDTGPHPRFVEILHAVELATDAIAKITMADGDPAILIGGCCTAPIEESRPNE